MTTEVKQHLTSHKEIDTSKVTVSVDQKTVYLSGRVDNAHAKKLANNITAQEIKQCGRVVDDELAYDRDNNEAPKTDDAAID